MGRNSFVQEIGHWKQKEKTTILQNIVWVMSNLCRNKPVPSLSFVKPAFDVF